MLLFFPFLPYVLLKIRIYLPLLFLTQSFIHDVKMDYYLKIPKNQNNWQTLYFELSFNNFIYLNLDWLLMLRKSKGTGIVWKSGRMEIVFNNCPRRM